MQSVIFGTIDSYQVLGLFLTDSGVQIGTPEPKRMFADVPVRDGLLELKIDDDIKYGNREILLEFVIANYQEDRWQSIFSEVEMALHGQHFHVYIEPDLVYYWDAFVTVDKHSSDRHKGTIVVKLDAYPYKQFDISVSVTASSGGTTVKLPVSKQRVIPTVTAASAITIVKDGTSYSYASGTHKNPGLVLEPGQNVLSVKGSGSVTIAYKDGTF